jgi:inner membrane protein
MPSPEEEPKSFAWLTAAATLLLPVLGVVTALIGVFETGLGYAGGWYWIAAGVILIIADMLIDTGWGRSAVALGRKPQPDSTARRGAELVGQLVTVIDPIHPGGRGTVRAADTDWAAEGDEAAPGTRVRVAGIRGTVLLVERI